MYGIFTYIYHKNQPNVGVYTIHGSYGYRVLYIQTVVGLGIFEPSTVWLFKVGEIDSSGLPKRQRPSVSFPFPSRAVGIS